MFPAREMPTVSMRELCHGPRDAIRRVLHGERLIVTRHGHPVATLQPLTGYVTQPFEGRSYDVEGRPFEDIDRQIANLRPIERRLLMNGVKLDRIYPSRHGVGDLSEALAALREWEARGLARRSRRGYVLTGRSLMLREALLMKAGRRDDLYK